VPYEEKLADGIRELLGSEPEWSEMPRAASALYRSGRS
jgi:hypothetical protein